MAEYIDKDKLKQELKDYYCIFPAMVKRAIENAPVITIDEDYAIQCTCYALGCQQAEQIETKAKQEAYKEIFEEIEKNTEFCIRFIENTTLFDNEEEIRKTKLECYRDCVGYFAKLKKRYIGE